MKESLLEKALQLYVGDHVLKSINKLLTCHLFCFVNTIYRKFALFVFLISFALIIFTTSLNTQTMSNAGISTRVQNYINECNFSSEIVNDERFKNCLVGIIKTHTVPENATTIASLSQIVSGGTYVLNDDITITSKYDVPSNVNLYIIGSVTKNGNFSEADENKEDIMFNINGKSNITLIGINGAEIKSNMKSVGFYIANSNNIIIDGFKITDTWEAVSVQWDADNINVLNNYIVNTTRRAIWMLGADHCITVHNFIENTGFDGLDWDAYTHYGRSFENVVISAGRWCGFVEEAAQNNNIVRNLGIMADFWPSNPGWQMGWADNGTTQGIIDQSGQLTQDNYFINCVCYQPTSYTSMGGGGYFANKNADKGMTYFWGCDEYGVSHGGNKWYNVEWLDSVPPAGQIIIEEMDAIYNYISTAITPEIAEDENEGTFTPQNFVLFQNFPNPFNPFTTITYNLNKSNDVILKIFNLTGQEIEILVNCFQAIGRHKITWQPKGLPSGIYFYKLQVGDKVIETKKMILMR